MQHIEQRVYVIDDDEAVRDSIRMLLESAGFKPAVYSDADSFLKDYRPEMSGCLVLDIQMPAISGLMLQEELLAIGSGLPIIFVTGHADVRTAVQALKAGAFDFIQKPFDSNTLLGHVQRALDVDADNRRALRQQQQVRERLQTLTPRETEVLNYIINGKATKVIAIELSLSQRTVEIYRANVMQKMQSRSVAQLVRMISEFKASPIGV